MLRHRELVFLFLLSSSAFRIGETHEGHGDEAEGSCELNPEIRVSAEYRPGIVTLDGRAYEWEDVDGFELELLPALDPDQDKAYGGGKMTVKSLHDGSNVFFLLQVDGDYAYTRGESKKCPSVALMFPIGEKASYNSMGGCKDMPPSCTNKSCKGHEVDIMHFSLGTAVPGRLYGSNPVDNQDRTGGDRFGHLVDLYAWNPHCRYLDGKGASGNSSSAQNDWRGAWWHSSLPSHSGFIEDDSPYSDVGKKGTYYFEFSRPLRTMDRLQQDVQFSIGQPSKMSVAFWYPVSGNPWSGSGHFSVSCDWLPMDIIPASGNPMSAVASKDSWDATSGFALILSIVAVSLSVFVGYRITKSKSVPFTPIDHL